MQSPGMLDGLLYPLCHLVGTLQLLQNQIIDACAIGAGRGRNPQARNRTEHGYADAVRQGCSAVMRGGNIGPRRIWTSLQIIQRALDREIYRGRGAHGSYLRHGRPCRAAAGQARGYASRA